MRLTVYYILSILVIYVMNTVDLAIPVRQYTDQNDISERCKRRVAPSIYLGKQVMDTSSHVMQFSRLEMPYTCSLSVRAEIGYNIIMIIRLLSTESLQEACSQNPNQLIVYELGETFGGYWGHMPDVVVNNVIKNYTKFYTIKTTKTTTTTTQSPTTYTEEETFTDKILTQTMPATEKEPDYISMIVPLVNVAGNLQLSDPLHTYNPEELFDYIYDVTPKNGTEYTTTLMPLVQFSIRREKIENNEQPRYELVYDAKDFTVDSRLKYSTKHRMSTKRSNWLANKKYNLRRKNKITRTNVSVTYKKLFTPWPHFTPISRRTTKIPTQDVFHLTLPWRDLGLSVTASSTVNENIMLRNTNKANVQHTPNLSAYYDSKSSPSDDMVTTYHGDLNVSLSSNPDSKYDQKTAEIESITPFSSDYLVVRNIKIGIEDNIRKKMLAIKKVDLSESNNENNSKETTYTKSDKILKDDERNISTLAVTMRNDLNLPINGTLVNHESWENVVQSAHVIANILNSTELKQEILNINKTLVSHQNKQREKRYVKSLDIEKSRPRNLTTKTYTATETKPINSFDMQQLARLVELQDDEIGGRVALRYLRSYVGGTLFNICDFKEAESEQMFLFNTSRIVIAVSNMTLDRMMLVLTPAFPIFGNLSRCPSAHLECQIIGSRVCIDSLNACDGIPNCGSYDIYDEDRRVCGVAKGLPHNVYVAAFSFLALLLTLLYTIYYWLKRCVPRVSEAFFIYSDTSENRLQLATIMRSPTDVDNFSDRFDPGNFFDNVSLQDYQEQGKRSNFFTRICTAYCGFLLCIKRHKQQEIKEKDSKEYDFKEKPTKIYSFTELELRKYTHILRDEGVQTGDSIDIRVDNNKITQNVYQSNACDSLTKYKLARLSDEDLKYKDELSLLKFTKDSKSSQNDITTERERERIKKKRHTLPSEEEEEIKNTVYEHPPKKIPPSKIPVTCEIHHENIKKANTSKHLRFNDSPTLIPTMNFDEDISEASNTKDGSLKGSDHSNKYKLETVDENDSKDFMRFWKIRNKKSKNKTKLHSPR